MELFTIENLIALLTLSLLEIVLGIDNIVFIALLTGKVDESKRAKARKIGLMLAMGSRVGLLLSISWIIRMTSPIFTVFDHGVSVRDLILLIGGLFLVAKATHEIHEKVEPQKNSESAKIVETSMRAVIIQIVIIDMIFSLDSVITAVGMANNLPIMITAVILAVLVMMKFSGTISNFIEKHPTLKVLALSFLILIGVMLIAEGMGRHVEKGYIYFAMAFALGVEFINIRARRTAQSVLKV